ncbi:MAG TPA: hypothetical protein VLG50_01770 [Candidatus Saccharimonadales bacterium]|nr:hypothetical protein [Candidatus Saccharimonadales bacterium]
MGKYLEIINNLLCKYLGLSTQKVTPVFLKSRGDKMIVISTESFKRHSYTKNVLEFISNKIEDMDKCNKAKLGSALGKSVAKNLKISFENLSIKEDDTHDHR